MRSESALHQDDPGRLLRDACAELSRRLRSGEDCRAESFLQAHPSLASNPEHAFELIYTEFLVRQELGQQPDPSDWLDRFPQWKEDLERLFSLRRSSADSRPPDPITVVHTPKPEESHAPGPKGLGKQFGQYELVEELGRGGMGVVYKAWDTVLGRWVALKMIRGPMAGAQDVQRFYREAQAAAKLQHPNIVPIHYFGRHEDQDYITMPYCGGTLAQQKDLLLADPRAAVALVEKVARAVHFLHEKGILHRDLKLANVLIDDQGEPLVSDFGLAKFLDADVELTQVGQFVGTPAYMAPEQICGGPNRNNAQSDVWALGVILFELLTGRRPFSGQALKDVSHQIATAEPPRPRALRPELDRALEAVVLRCLEKEPNRRYRSAQALAEDLQRWQAGEPPVARPESRARLAWRAVRRHPVLAVVAVLLAAAVAALPLALHLTDPDRPLKDIQQKLAMGQPVTLLGHTGPPKWFRWLLSDNPAGVTGLPDQPFAVSNLGNGLLELLPHAQLEQYRFRAEVRHQDGSQVAEVGIYFAHRKFVTPSGTYHVYCKLTFDDQQDTRGDRDARGRKRGKVSVHCVRDFLPQSGQPGSNAYLLAGLRGGFPVSAPPLGPGNWRSIGVEVTRVNIRTFWENQPIGPEIKWAALREITREIQKDNPALRTQGASLLGTGLGLYIRSSAGAFRSVVVEPFGNSP
jgi:serine/threonine-protein kinase